MIKIPHNQTIVLNWQQWRLKSDNPDLNKRGLKSRVRNTLVFIESLRAEVEKIVPVENLSRRRFGASLELSYNKLNIYLGQSERYIEKRIEYCKKKSLYFLSYIKLLDMKYWLRLKFGSSSIPVIKLIDNYMKYHKLNIPFSHENRFQIYKHHPYFNERYFSDIDTIEKAYWVGFFFADGTISNGKRLCLYLSANPKYIKSNHNHLIRFCKAIGLNPEYIDFIHRLEKDKKIQYRHFTLIQFSSKEMANNIYRLGFKGSRSKATIWPKMRIKNSLLDLAFLLGFYDGEADVGRSRTYSANKDLLMYIKLKFNIPYKVLPNKNAYSLSLSGQLVNLMQAIFPKSLELKRHNFRKRNIELIFNNLLSKGILSEIVRILSKKKIADIFGVEVDKIFRLLEILEIEDNI